MKTHLIILFVGFALSYSTNLKAQNSGTITGTVVEAETGESLIGVNVIIEETTQGTATDLDGNFAIKNIQPGTYTLVVSYVSFQKQIVSGVEVQPGGKLQFDFALKPDTETLEDVVITAGAILNNEAGMLRQRRKTISFSDAISAENISNAGAGDAASALSKVTGASVVDGKYVYVRGLGDRYTTTQLNGLELPTSDPDRKSFQLDLLPSNLLENIVTLKTFTPDKPGNFSGGLVDVNTKSLPEKLFVTLSAKQGYNTASSFNDILLGDESNTDWLGFDSGLRAIPEEVVIRNNNQFPKDTEARFDPNAAEELNTIANSFNSSFLPSARQVGLNQSYSIGFGNRHNLAKDVHFGYTLSYSYALNNKSYSNGRNARYQLLGQYEESETLSPNTELTDNRGVQTVDWGLLGSAGLVFDTSNKITFNFLQTQSGENSGRYLHGYWEQLNSDNAELRSRVNQHTERDLVSYQLSGNHNFQSLNNIQIDWNTAIQSNGQEQPDLRFLSSDARFIRDQSTGMIVDTLLGNDNSQHPRPARLFRDLNESKFSGTIDITIPIELPSQTMSVKIGGLYESTERYFVERRFDYQQGRNFFLNQFESEEAFLNQLGVLGYDDANRPQIGNYVVSATTDRSSYDATQDISAFYGMVDINLLKDLKLATGFRYEQTDLRTASRDTTLIDSDRFGVIDKGDILPTAMLIYSYNENANIRAAVSQTLARPTFRELTPYVSFDFVGDNLFRGNASLDRTLITNYDLRWEWFPNSREILSVSTFYKSIDNPIERVLRFDIAEKAESVQNVDAGRVMGVEFEMRKNLGNVAEFLSPFQITTNLTFVHSEVDIPEAELIQIRQTHQNPETKRPLAGQSPFIANIDLGYMNPKLGLTSNISFNTFGDRLSKVSQGAAPDVYERSYSTLNFNINKNLGRHFTLSLSASNLLNPKVKYSQIFKGKEYIYQQYSTGRTFAVGVKYNL